MILYVTSFDQRLYDASGKQLVQSFLNSGSEGILFNAFEGDCDLPKTDNIINYNLGEDQKFLNWLIDNSNYIPREFGGSAPPCRCESWEILSNGCHKKGCAHSIWNRRASGWARKTFAMIKPAYLARGMIRSFIPHLIDYILWVDSDSVFTGKITENILGEIFGDANVVYHYGSYRKKLYGSAETGLMGFKGKGGQFIIENVYQRYMSKDYLKESRWDDSHLYTQEFERYSKSKDLISSHVRSSHVVQYGPFSKYITHNKNFHHRNKIV